MVMILSTALLQFPAAQIARPLIDAQLAAIDRAVYFDWPACFAWVVRHPTAVHVLSAVYLSLGVQSVLLCFLGWSRPRRVAVCLAANALTLTCCLTVFVVWPAGGAFAYYHPVGIGSSYVEQFMAARSALITGLTLDQVEGIIQFPSYHAAAAVLLAYAFASLPRWIAVPGIIFETTLAVSAVPMGGHHLVDVLAGAAVGAASLAIATRFATVRSGERHPLLRSAQPANSRSVIPI
jgi:membrane-associated phospholipid phosphatase